MFTSHGLVLSSHDQFGDDQQQEFVPAFASQTSQTDSFLGGLNGVELMSNNFLLPNDLTDPFRTPPQTGFDGYLAGNVDYDDALLGNTAAMLPWDTSFPTQDFTMIDDSSIPPPSSVSSESQNWSPVDMFLPLEPLTPPELAAFAPLSAPPLQGQLEYSSATTPPTPSENATTTKKASRSTGPKYVPPSLALGDAWTLTYGYRRQLRKIIKPETCPVCGRGHAQLRERDRHIVTHHFEEAVRMGLNTERPTCQICDQDFRRKDHLTRHMKRRHGW